MFYVKVVHSLIVKMFCSAAEVSNLGLVVIDPPAVSKVDHHSIELVWERLDATAKGDKRCDTKSAHFKIKLGTFYCLCYIIS